MLTCDHVSDDMFPPIAVADSGFERIHVRIFDDGTQLDKLVSVFDLVCDWAGDLFLLQL